MPILVGMAVAEGERDSLFGAFLAMIIEAVSTADLPVMRYTIGRGKTEDNFHHLSCTSSIVLRG
jgi:hypothetical protein